MSFIIMALYSCSEKDLANEEETSLKDYGIDIKDPLLKEVLFLNQNLMRLLLFFHLYYERWIINTKFSNNSFSILKIHVICYFLRR